MKTVFVAAGMNTPNSKKIISEAKELARCIAKNGCRLAQGGSARGIMGIMLKEYLKYASDPLILLPKTFIDVDGAELEAVLGKNYKPQIMDGEYDRLCNLIKCDLVIIFPGGTGTFLEMMYCNETKRSGENKSQVIVLNIDNFFDGFYKQLEINTSFGFSKNEDFKLEVVSSVDELSNLLEKCKF